MLDPGTRTLVAGVGNIFLRDDGFGSEVAQRLATRALPEGVEVVDYGIGGIHLAYDLLAGVDLLVLVDALRRGVEPGTLTVFEVDDSTLPETAVDSHAMDPAAVLSNVQALGAALPPTLIVGCEPEDASEGMGLTDTVAASVEPALDLVLEGLEQHHHVPAPQATR